MITNGMVPAILVMLATALAQCAPVTANWNQWLGPARNGVTPESSGWTGAEWPLVKVWQKEVGAGPTSPILVDGRIYVMGWKGNTDTVRCLDAATGNELWAQSYPCAKNGIRSHGDAVNYWHGGPLSTPALDETTGLLYTLSCSGDLNCWDTRNQGERKWGFNLIEKYEIDSRKDAKDDWYGNIPEDEGVVCSPLRLGDWVIVEPGSETDGELMAFNKRTGERAWKSQYNDDAGHSSPVALTVQGKPCVAALALNNLVVMRADPGHEGETIGTVHCNGHAGHNICTPMVQGNRILFTCAFNLTKMWWLEASLTGIKEIWAREQLNCRVSTPVIHQSAIYGVIVVGDKRGMDWDDNRERLRSLDLANGNQKWADMDPDKGSSWDGTCLVTAADNKLIARFGKTIRLVDIAGSPNQYQELARIETGVGDLPSLAFANGFLVCKDMKGKIACFRRGARP